MAKSLLERMADKDRELNTIRQAVQTEIRNAEERLTAIDAELSDIVAQLDEPDPEEEPA